MSFFEDASLVLIPSAQKTSKVYSVKPTDGTGDLTFTRSNDTATRVGPDGLIEKVRTNLVLQSNTFSTTWTLDDVTLTSGQSGYDGTNNAWRLAKTAAGGRVQQSLSLSSNSHTFSVYVKAGTKNWVFLRIDGTSNRTSYFDLQNGVVGTASGCTPSIVSAGNGWYRCSISYVDTTTSVRIWVADADGDISGTSGNILIQAAQLETGDIATDYIATTSAAVSVGPVANVPRLDYLNSSCPRLLLEPQRTNALTYSEDFSNAAYTKGQSSITSNAAIAPDGTMSADKLVEDTSNNPHVIYRSPSGTGDTLSFFAKAAERNWVGVLSNNGNISFFNIANGTLGTIAAGSTATITPYGNGWYRCTLYNTHGSFGMSIYLATANGTDTYTGDGTSGAFIWGAQLEESAAYATSYIPTLGAAVTRGAETAIKTSATALIGQTEGTIFLEFQKNAGVDAANIAFSLSDGTSANLIYYNFEGPVIEFIASSSVQAIKSGGINLVAGTNKIAVYYKANDFGIYLNGTSIFTDTSGSVGAMSKFNLGSFFNDAYPVGTPINQAILFKTRLTNAQLAELTTL